MAISTLDDYIASKKQIALYKKTASVTAVAQMLTSVFSAAGLPGAGTLAGANTANGVVPTDATAGFPTINAFDGGANGYLTRISAYNSVASSIQLVDVLFKAGAYSFNSNVTLASQPSYSSRVPGGTDYTGLEIWIEAVTAFTGNLTITVGYYNENNVLHSTGAIATGIAPIASRCIRLPLQAGDSGVQKIDSVLASVSTVGTFNVLVVRPLARFRIPYVGYAELRDLYTTGMPEVFADSAIAAYVIPDSTATGLPEIEFEVANK